VQVDALPRLAVLLLRGNPCLRTRADRACLLALLRAAAAPSGPLRCLDAPITVDERLAALAARAPGAARAPEAARAEAALALAAPPGAPAARVRALDLSALSLAALPPLAAYAGLRRLSLRANALAALPAGAFPAGLEALDARCNRLAALPPALAALAPLAALRELGLEGNPFQGVADEGSCVDAPALRRAVLRALAGARLAGKDGAGAAWGLRFLDDCEVSFGEVEAAWDATPGEKARFRFHEAVRRAQADQVRRAAPRRAPRAPRACHGAGPDGRCAGAGVSRRVEGGRWRR